MQKIVTSLFFTCLFITGAAASENAVTENNLKSFNLNIGDSHSANQAPLQNHNFNFDEDEPSAGDVAFIDRFNVQPELNYGKKDDDYNARLDQYETEVKLRVKVPVDIDFK